MLYPPSYLLKRRHHLCDRLAFLVPASLDDFAKTTPSKPGKTSRANFSSALVVPSPPNGSAHAAISYANDPSADGSLLVTGRPFDVRPRSGIPYAASP